MSIFRGPPEVSAMPDRDGNYRAAAASHPGFVGYGRTRHQAGENLIANFHSHQQATPLAEFETRFMLLSKEDQERFRRDLDGLSGS